MSEGWSPQQHEWLQAMGLQVFALAGVEPVVGEPSLIEPPAAASRQPASASSGRAGRTSSPNPTRDAGVGQPPLLRALLKAARREAGDPDFVQAVPDVDALRGNAAAKRAAWPRLRALRRAGRA